MRPLWTLLALGIAVSHAYPTGNYGQYIYPSHPPPNLYGDDYSHRFHYKEYFPPPPGVGVGHLDTKLYASGHAYPSISSSVENIAASIGHHVDNKVHAVKEAISSVSDQIGGKISYLTSGTHDPFKGYYADGAKSFYAPIPDPFKGYQYEAGKNVYVNDHGGYGYHDEGGAVKHVAHTVGSAVSGSVSAIKSIHAGISDTISSAAKSVGETVGSAVHTVKVAGSDLSDHLSRTAVHVKKGISGTISDTTHTTKTLFGILGEFLSNKVHIIRESAGKSYNNAGHALSQASAAIARQVGRAALGVGEFLQNKAHEINYSIQKKVLRSREHPHVEYVEPPKHEIEAYPKKIEGFGGVHAGGVIDSGYAVSGAGPSVYGGVDGYGVQKSALLFQPTKVAIPLAPAPLPVVADTKYIEASYSKL